MATYAIGDVQGCFDELLDLLDAIAFDQSQDRLVFVGDLVNRGPKSLATLDLIRDLCRSGLARTVLGNHDLHLLALWSKQIPSHKYDNLQPLLADAQADDLCHWLSQQPLFIRDPELSACFVHAGLYPLWTPNQAEALATEVSQALQGDQRDDFFRHMYGNDPQLWQADLQGYARLRFITNALTRMRFCSQQGQLELHTKESAEQSPLGFMPWFELPAQEPQMDIVFGHWAALSHHPNNRPFYAIDTGCVWGASLTALRIEDKERIQVASRQPKRY